MLKSQYLIELSFKYYMWCSWDTPLLNSKAAYLFWAMIKEHLNPNSSLQFLFAGKKAQCQLQGKICTIPIVTLSYTKISFTFLELAPFSIIQFASTLQKKSGVCLSQFRSRIFPALICSGLRTLGILFRILLIPGSTLFVKAHQAYSHQPQVCSALGDSRLCDQNRAQYFMCSFIDLPP